MLTHFATPLPVRDEATIRRSCPPARAPVQRGRTQERVKMARYIEESPRYTPAGALMAVNAALKKAGR